MSTWINTIKNIVCRAFLLNEDMTFMLLEDGFKIIICDGINNQTKNTSTWTNQTKN